MKELHELVETTEKASQVTWSRYCTVIERFIASSREICWQELINVNLCLMVSE